MMLRDTYAEVWAPEYHPNPVRGRVFVTDQRVIVYTAGEGGGLRKLIEEPITGALPQRTRATQPVMQMELETAGGRIEVQPNGDCGCGTALKALDPPADWY